MMNILDLFIKIYGLKFNNSFLILLKIDKVIRFIIKFLSNIVFPIYFRISSFSLTKINKDETRFPKIIVSFTTYPGRIKYVWLIVECMLRQKLKPDKLILWLSIEQFPSKKFLPSQLLEYEDRGLEIYLCDGDLKSHKKYYYSLKQFPNDLLVTIDDDFFYPSYLLSDLINLHEKYPKAICCERGHLIKFKKNSIDSYNNWSFLSSGRGPSFDIFQTSGGGTLYPPSSLHPEVLNSDFFLENCKTADDVWLNTMSQLNSTKIIKSNIHFEPIPILVKSDFKLSSINVTENQNNVQISKVREFVISKYEIDPFYNIISK